MQPDGSLDPMSIVKAFAVLAVVGAFTAKLALDWVNGKRPFRGETGDSGGSTSEESHSHHGGWWDGDDGGGHGDGGDGGRSRSCVNAFDRP